MDGPSAEPARLAAGLGPSGASPDVIYAFGHGHVGMTSAPMTGKIVADLVAGRPPRSISPRSHPLGSLSLCCCRFAVFAG